MKDDAVAINEAEDVNDAPKKNEGCLTKPKLLILVLLCAIGVLVIYFMVIISKVKNDKGKDKKKPNENGPTPVPEIDKNILGKINCLYRLDEDEDSNVLNPDFNFQQNLCK